MMLAAWAAESAICSAQGHQYVQVPSVVGWAKMLSDRTAAPGSGLRAYRRGARFRGVCTVALQPRHLSSAASAWSLAVTSLGLAVRSGGVKA